MSSSSNSVSSNSGSHSFQNNYLSSSRLNYLENLPSLEKVAVINLITSSLNVICNRFLDCPLAGKVSLTCGLGLLILKISASAWSIQSQEEKVLIKEEDHIWYKHAIYPPENSDMTDAQNQLNKLYKNVASSANEILDEKFWDQINGEVFGTFKMQTLEKLCNSCMQVGLKIGQGVYDDLEKWGDDTIQYHNKYLSKKEILTSKFRCMKADDGRKYRPWTLYGFFVFPKCYRSQVNLFNGTKLEDEWKDLFFEEGTIQFQWRTAFNEWSDKITQLIGGGYGDDQRFSSWARKHTYRSQWFSSHPDTTPT